MTDINTQPVTAPEAARDKTNASISVNVRLLDALMTLAGELVLSRNQLLQGVSKGNIRAIEVSSQRIDMITSELQETIMRTRMQPMANVLDTFNPLVRDLSRQSNKSIELVIEGREVELDKTILEAISDPLTQLVKNSVDQGIETAVERERSGKNPTGKITLGAFHDAGHINIVISDDGRGLDPEALSALAVSKGLVTEQQIAGFSERQKLELIFLPGFSTDGEISKISIGSIGMDAVAATIENIGGILELNSDKGIGTDIHIKLPLTLAIIPSQITSVGGDRYAVPQVNLDELLRIPVDQIKEKIEKVGDAEVVRLRGELLPLLDLSKMLDIEKKYVDPANGMEVSDRRISVADRRSKQHLASAETTVQNAIDSVSNWQARETKDRRSGVNNAVNIAVVSSGAYKYGLVVGQLHDSEEIVVKPVGRHLKRCMAFAGATVMGDGKVALILDIANLAQMAELSTLSEVKKLTLPEERMVKTGKEKAALLTFRNSATEFFAVPLDRVERIERIQTQTIEHIGERKVVQYRGGALPLCELSQIIDIAPLSPGEQQEIIVFKVGNRELGLMVTPPLDTFEVFLDVDESTLHQPGISGSMIIGDHTTLLLDVFALARAITPEWFD
jgi:two-component system, chemotaxis family, sensor kinase CheA